MWNFCNCFFSFNQFKPSPWKQKRNPAAVRCNVQQYMYTTPTPMRPSSSRARKKSRNETQTRIQYDPVQRERKPKPKLRDPLLSLVLSCGSRCRILPSLSSLLQNQTDIILILLGIILLPVDCNLILKDFEFQIEEITSIFPLKSALVSLYMSSFLFEFWRLEKIVRRK